MRCLRVMQKLLRKSPSGPILCTLGNPTLAPFSFSVDKNFLSLGFRNPSVYSSLSLFAFSMPSASSFASGSAIAGSFSKTRASTISSRFGAAAAASRNCCICRCLIENRAPIRAWVVCKNGRPGYRAAWLQTASDGSLSTSAVEGAKKWENSLECFRDGEGGEAETGSEEKPVRLHRRQRGSSSGGALTDNPDLLTIPGVGPRNLRKLVENGISGVAELKQLYKDKVLDWTINLFVFLCICCG